MSGGGGEKGEEGTPAQAPALAPAPAPALHRPHFVTYPNVCPCVGFKVSLDCL